MVAPPSETGSVALRKRRLGFAAGSQVVDRNASSGKGSAHEAGVAMGLHAKPSVGSAALAESKRVEERRTRGREAGLAIQESKSRSSKVDKNCGTDPHTKKTHLQQ
jgi:hypothetical protein